MKKPQSVDEYIEAGGDWRESLALLRGLFTSTILEETVKWGMPVYTLKGKNVAGFNSFKSWTGIWFYQGVFLSDPEGVLLSAQEGATKALRQWRFKSLEEIKSQRNTILNYLNEAILNQEAGKEIKPDRNKALNIPAELKQAINRDPALKVCFESFSRSKKREYAEYVGSAKREETRQQRLEKSIPLILEGIGLNDKYRK